MSKKRFFKSKVEKVISPTGKIISINKYVEFNDYIKNTPETIFSQHYNLLKNQIGVYKFTVNGLCYYVGYSCDLNNRIRESFFNNCFLQGSVEIQYILCDSKEEAMDIELHYIRIIKPRNNWAGIRDTKVINTKILEFCAPIRVFFNEYYIDKQNSRE